MRSIKRTVLSGIFISLLTLLIITPTNAFASQIQSLNGLTTQTQLLQSAIGNIQINSSGNTHVFSWNGFLPISMGGTGVGSFSNGSVPFISTGVFSQDNSNLFWDNTNKRLGIGTNNPLGQLHLGGAGQAATNNYGVLIDNKTAGTNNYNIWSGPLLSAFDSQIQTDVTGTEGTNVFTSTNGTYPGWFLSQGQDSSNALAATSYNTTGEEGVNLALIGTGISIAPVGQRTRIVTGGYFRGDNEGTGTVADLSGIFVDTNRPTSGGGTTERSAGIHIEPQAGGQTNYGIYVIEGANPNNYALYTAGDAKSYFGGNVGIGTTNPSTLLDVAGTIKGDSTMFLGNSTTPACIEAADSDGSGVSYITVNDGVISASTTKPSFCQ